MSYELLTNRKTENRHKNYRQVNDMFFLVVHWWDDKKGLSFDSNVNFLCKNNNKVSAHYVSEGGRVAQIAENEDVALHAGNWNMNVASIGVENRPEADSDDFATLAELIVDIETKIGHTLYIIGHRDVVSRLCPGVYYPRIPELINRVNTIKSQRGNAPAPLTEEQRADMLSRLQNIKNNPG